MVIPGLPVNNWSRLMSGFMDGTYLVQFRGPLGDVGGGVVTISGNRVSGGDSGYMYTGSFDVVGSVARGEIAVVRHDPAAISVLGNFDQFDLVLEGPVGDVAKFLGHVKAMPQFRIEVRLILQKPMAAE